jgi:S-adenosylmethionine synthetase
MCEHRGICKLTNLLAEEMKKVAKNSTRNRKVQVHSTRADDNKAESNFLTVTYFRKMAMTVPSGEATVQRPITPNRPLA